MADEIGDIRSGALAPRKERLARGGAGEQARRMLRGGEAFGQEYDITVSEGRVYLNGNLSPSLRLVSRKDPGIDGNVAGETSKKGEEFLLVEVNPATQTQKQVLMGLLSKGDGTFVNIPGIGGGEDLFRGMGDLMGGRMKQMAGGVANMFSSFGRGLMESGTEQYERGQERETFGAAVERERGDLATPAQALKSAVETAPLMPTLMGLGRLSRPLLKRGQERAPAGKDLATERSAVLTAGAIGSGESRAQIVQEAEAQAEEQWKQDAELAEAQGLPPPERPEARVPSRMYSAGAGLASAGLAKVAPSGVQRMLTGQFGAKGGAKGALGLPRAAVSAKDFGAYEGATEGLEELSQELASQATGMNLEELTMVDALELMAMASMSGTATGGVAQVASSAGIKMFGLAGQALAAAKRRLRKPGTPPAGAPEAETAGPAGAEGEVAGPEVGPDTALEGRGLAGPEVSDVPSPANLGPFDPDIETGSAGPAEVLARGPAARMAHDNIAAAAGVETAKSEIERELVEARIPPKAARTMADEMIESGMRLRDSAGSVEAAAQKLQEVESADQWRTLTGLEHTEQGWEKDRQDMLQVVLPRIRDHTHPEFERAHQVVLAYESDPGNRPDSDASPSMDAARVLYTMALDRQREGESIQQAIVRLSNEGDAGGVDRMLAYLESGVTNMRRGEDVARAAPFLVLEVLAQNPDATPREVVGTVLGRLVDEDGQFRKDGLLGAFERGGLHNLFMSMEGPYGDAYRAEMAKIPPEQQGFMQGEALAKVSDGALAGVSAPSTETKGETWRRHAKAAMNARDRLNESLEVLLRTGSGKEGAQHMAAIGDDLGRMALDPTRAVEAWRQNVKARAAGWLALYKAITFNGLREYREGIPPQVVDQEGDGIYVKLAAKLVDLPGVAEAMDDLRMPASREHRIESIMPLMPVFTDVLQLKAIGQERTKHPTVDTGSVVERQLREGAPPRRRVPTNVSGAVRAHREAQGTEGADASFSALTVAVRDALGETRGTLQADMAEDAAVPITKAMALEAGLEDEVHPTATDPGDQVFGAAMEVGPDEAVPQWTFFRGEVVDNSGNKARSREGGWLRVRTGKGQYFDTPMSLVAVMHGRKAPAPEDGSEPAPPPTGIGFTSQLQARLDALREIPRDKPKEKAKPGPKPKEKAPPDPEAEAKKAADKQEREMKRLGEAADKLKRQRTRAEEARLKREKKEKEKRDAAAKRAADKKARDEAKAAELKAKAEKRAAEKKVRDAKKAEEDAAKAERKAKAEAERAAKAALTEEQARLKDSLTGSVESVENRLASLAQLRQEKLGGDAEQFDPIMDGYHQSVSYELSEARKWLDKWGKDSTNQHINRKVMNHLGVASGYVDKIEKRLSTLIGQEDIDRAAETLKAAEAKVAAEREAARLAEQEKREGVGKAKALLRRARNLVKKASELPGTVPAAQAAQASEEAKAAVDAVKAEADKAEGKPAEEPASTATGDFAERDKKLWKRTDKLIGSVDFKFERGAPTVALVTAQQHVATAHRQLTEVSAQEKPDPRDVRRVSHNLDEADRRLKDYRKADESRAKVSKATTNVRGLVGRIGRRRDSLPWMVGMEAPTLPGHMQNIKEVADDLAAASEMLFGEEEVGVPGEEGHKGPTGLMARKAGTLRAKARKMRDLAGNMRDVATHEENRDEDGNFLSRDIATLALRTAADEHRAVEQSFLNELETGSDDGKVDLEGYLREDEAEQRPVPRRVPVGEQIQRVFAPSFADFARIATGLRGDDADQGQEYVERQMSMREMLEGHISQLEGTDDESASADRLRDALRALQDADQLVEKLGGTKRTGDFAEQVGAALDKVASALGFVTEGADSAIAVGQLAHVRHEIRTVEGEGGPFPILFTRFTTLEERLRRIDRAVVAVQAAGRHHAEVASMAEKIGPLAEEVKAYISKVDRGVDQGVVGVGQEGTADVQAARQRAEEGGTATARPRISRSEWLKTPEGQERSDFTNKWNRFKSMLSRAERALREKADSDAAMAARPAATERAALAARVKADFIALRDRGKRVAAKLGSDPNMRAPMVYLAARMRSLAKMEEALWDPDKVKEGEVAAKHDIGAFERRWMWARQQVENLVDQAEMQLDLYGADIGEMARRAEKPWPEKVDEVRERILDEFFLVSRELDKAMAEADGEDGLLRDAALTADIEVVGDTETKEGDEEGADPRGPRTVYKLTPKWKTAEQKSRGEMGLKASGYMRQMRWLWGHVHRMEPARFEKQSRELLEKAKEFLDIKKGWLAAAKTGGTRPRTVAEEAALRAKAEGERRARQEGRRKPSRKRKVTKGRSRFPNLFSDTAFKPGRRTFMKQTASAVVGGSADATKAVVGMVAGGGEYTGDIVTKEETIAEYLEFAQKHGLASLPGLPTFLVESLNKMGAWDITVEFEEVQHEIERLVFRNASRLTHEEIAGFPERMSLAVQIVKEIEDHFKKTGVPPYSSFYEMFKAAAEIAGGMQDDLSRLTGLAARGALSKVGKARLAAGERQALRRIGQRNREKSWAQEDREIKRGIAEFATVLARVAQKVEGEEKRRLVRDFASSVRKVAEGKKPPRRVTRGRKRTVDEEFGGGFQEVEEDVMEGEEYAAFIQALPSQEAREWFDKMTQDQKNMFVKMLTQKKRDETVKTALNLKYTRRMAAKISKHIEALDTMVRELTEGKPVGTLADVEEGKAVVPAEMLAQFRMGMGEIHTNALGVSMLASGHRAWDVGKGMHWGFLKATSAAVQIRRALGADEAPVWEMRDEIGEKFSPHELYPSWREMEEERMGRDAASFTSQVEEAAMRKAKNKEEAEKARRERAKAKAEGEAAAADPELDFGDIPDRSEQQAEDSAGFEDVEFEEDPDFPGRKKLTDMDETEIAKEKRSIQSFIRSVTEGQKRHAAWVRKASEEFTGFETLLRDINAALDRNERRMTGLDMISSQAMRGIEKKAQDEREFINDLLEDAERLLAERMKFPDRNTQARKRAAEEMARGKLVSHDPVKAYKAETAPKPGVPKPPKPEHVKLYAEDLSPEERRTVRANSEKLIDMVIFDVAPEEATNADVIRYRDRWRRVMENPFAMAEAEKDPVRKARLYELAQAMAARQHTERVKRSDADRKRKREKVQEAAQKQVDWLRTLTEQVALAQSGEMDGVRPDVAALITSSTAAEVEEFMESRRRAVESVKTSRDLFLLDLEVKVRKRLSTAQRKFDEAYDTAQDELDAVRAKMTAEQRKELDEPTDREGKLVRRDVLDQELLAMEEAHEEEMASLQSIIDDLGLVLAEHTEEAAEAESAKDRAESGKKRKAKIVKEMAALHKKIEKLEGQEYSDERDEEISALNNRMFDLSRENANIEADEAKAEGLAEAIEGRPSAEKTRADIEAAKAKMAEARASHEKAIAEAREASERLWESLTTEEQMFIEAVNLWNERFYVDERSNQVRLREADEIDQARRDIPHVFKGTRHESNIKAVVDGTRLLYPLHWRERRKRYLQTAREGIKKHREAGNTQLADTLEQQVRTVTRDRPDMNITDNYYALALGAVQGRPARLTDPKEIARQAKMTAETPGAATSKAQDFIDWYHQQEQITRRNAVAKGTWDAWTPAHIRSAEVFVIGVGQYMAKRREYTAAEAWEIQEFLGAQIWKEKDKERDKFIAKLGLLDEGSEGSNLEILWRQVRRLWNEGRLTDIDRVLAGQTRKHRAAAREAEKELVKVTKTMTPEDVYKRLVKRVRAESKRFELAEVLKKKIGMWHRKLRNSEEVYRGVVLSMPKGTRGDLGKIIGEKVLEGLEGEELIKAEQLMQEQQYYFERENTLRGLVSTRELYMSMLSQKIVEYIAETNIMMHAEIGKLVDDAAIDRLFQEQMERQKVEEAVREATSSEEEVAAAEPQVEEKPEKRPTVAEEAKAKAEGKPAEEEGDTGPEPETKPEIPQELADAIGRVKGLEADMTEALDADDQDLIAEITVELQAANEEMKRLFEAYNKRRKVTKGRKASPRDAEKTTQQIHDERQSAPATSRFVYSNAAQMLTLLTAARATEKPESWPIAMVKAELMLREHINSGKATGLRPPIGLRLNAKDVGEMHRVLNNLVVKVKRQEVEIPGNYNERAAQTVLKKLADIAGVSATRIPVTRVPKGQELAVREMFSPASLTLDIDAPRVQRALRSKTMRPGLDTLADAVRGTTTVNVKVRTRQFRGHRYTVRQQGVPAHIRVTREEDGSYSVTASETPREGRLFKRMSGADAANTVVAAIARAGFVKKVSVSELRPGDRVAGGFATMVVRERKVRMETDRQRRAGQGREIVQRRVGLIPAQRDDVGMIPYEDTARETTEAGLSRDERALILNDRGAQFGVGDAQLSKPVGKLSERERELVLASRRREQDAMGQTTYVDDRGDTVTHDLVQQDAEGRKGLSLEGLALMRQGLEQGRFESQQSIKDLRASAKKARTSAEFRRIWEEADRKQARLDSVEKELFDQGITYETDRLQAIERWATPDTDVVVSGKVLQVMENDQVVVQTPHGMTYVLKTEGEVYKNPVDVESVVSGMRDVTRTVAARFTSAFVSPTEVFKTYGIRMLLKDPGTRKSIQGLADGTRTAAVALMLTPQEAAGMRIDSDMYLALVKETPHEYSVRMMRGPVSQAANRLLQDGLITMVMPLSADQRSILNDAALKSGTYGELQKNKELGMPQVFRAADMDPVDVIGEVAAERGYSDDRKMIGEVREGDRILTVYMVDGLTPGDMEGTYEIIEGNVLATRKEKFGDSEIMVIRMMTDTGVREFDETSLVLDTVHHHLPDVTRGRRGPPDIRVYEGGDQEQAPGPVLKREIAPAMIASTRAGVREAYEMLVEVGNHLNQTVKQIPTSKRTVGEEWLDHESPDMAKFQHAENALYAGMTDKERSDMSAKIRALLGSGHQTGDLRMISDFLMRVSRAATERDTMAAEREELRALFMGRLAEMGKALEKNPGSSPSVVPAMGVMAYWLFLLDPAHTFKTIGEFSMRAREGEYDAELAALSAAVNQIGVEARVQPAGGNGIEFAPDITGRMQASARAGEVIMGMNWCPIGALRGGTGISTAEALRMVDDLSHDADPEWEGALREEGVSDAATPALLEMNGFRQVDLSRIAGNDGIVRIRDLSALFRSQNTFVVGIEGHMFLVREASVRNLSFGPNLKVKYVYVLGPGKDGPRPETPVSLPKAVSKGLDFGEGRQEMRDVTKNMSLALRRRLRELHRATVHDKIVSAQEWFNLLGDTIEHEDFHDLALDELEKAVAGLESLGMDKLPGASSFILQVEHSRELHSMIPFHGDMEHVSRTIAGASVAGLIVSRRIWFHANEVSKAAELEAAAQNAKYAGVPHDLDKMFRELLMTHAKYQSAKE